ncbi:MAG: HAD family phosphatase [Bryobacteraceae bacterium]|nr:HAD family phosphatase [Bryobacterales bacterium]MEB2362185.1 HAD family phosphatase [Bryobacterales bacterium]NUM99804.1 HAD family phosphatase [Bryobacteraceae bacterium]
MIRTVIFDLGGVIVPLDFTQGYTTISKFCSYPAAEIPRRLASTDLIVRFESGQIEPEKFAEELSELLGLKKIGYDTFCTVWSSIFLPHTLIPGELLDRVRRHHRLLLLSNTNAIHFDMLRRTYPILDRFDEFVLSYEVGAMKPSPRIYQEAVARAGCRPEECFFTDDVLAYVEGARKEGIDAVQFESQEQIERELRNRGVSLD